jgi:hypothetical protein
MTRLFVVEVLASLFVPTQLLTAHPTAGLAVSEIDSPAWYCPLEQPIELAGEAIGSLPLPVCTRVSV